MKLGRSVNAVSRPDTAVESLLKEADHLFTLSSVKIPRDDVP